MKQVILSLLIVVSVFAARAGEISGLSAVCIGASIKLNAATPGGSWGSSNAVVATIDQSGTVRGIATGTVLITYTVNGANSFIAVNVYPIGSPIEGKGTVCVGAKATLYSTAGGTWSSGSNSIATVDPLTGVVTGVAKGNASVTYSFGAACITAKTIAVDSCSKQGRR